MTKKRLIKCYKEKQGMYIRYMKLIPCRIGEGYMLVSLFENRDGSLHNDLNHMFFEDKEEVFRLFDLRNKESITIIEFDVIFKRFAIDNLRVTNYGGFH